MERVRACRCSSQALCQGALADAGEERHHLGATSCASSRFMMAASRSSLVAKWRNTVPMATPARWAASSVEVRGQ
jgi:hypothetical protein